MIPTILLVDDEPQFERLVKQRLRKKIKAGEFKLLFAKDGVEALKVLEAHQEIEMVLTDINMPNMDGLELAVYIRDSRRDVPVMLLTTETNPELIYQGNLAEIDGWLVKPFNLNSIVTRIKTIIS